MRELTGWSRDLRVTADADDVVAMVGVVGLRLLADRTGLTRGLPGSTPVHDRVDGTITLAHSAAKQQDRATFKKTFGFHSLGVWIDKTDELAALMPRPGGAGSNTAKDLIDVLHAAIAQIPTNRRGDLLITSDGAGASHPLIDWLHNLDQVPGRQVCLLGQPYFVT